MGYTGRGSFRGFKLRAAVNQLGLPLRAVVTTGKCCDGPFLPKLIDDLEADAVLADAGYCSKRNRQVVGDMGAVAFIADNPRRKGRACKIESGTRLKKERYVVEQFNGHLRVNLLSECWVRPKGLLRKRPWLWLV